MKLTIAILVILAMVELSNQCKPVDGHFGPWTEWFKCSKSCGGGKQIRARRCVGRKCGGKHCFGNVGENRKCNEQSCSEPAHYPAPAPSYPAPAPSYPAPAPSYPAPAPSYPAPAPSYPAPAPSYSAPAPSYSAPPPVSTAYLSQWTQWTECSASCGPGTQGRDRECVSSYGQTCPNGPLWEGRSCEKTCCPVNGVLSQWKSWGSCSKTCGGGKQSRSRSCTGQKCNGKLCDGALYETQDCAPDCCPVNGFLTLWGQWSACSATCGVGVRSRSRKCTAPVCKGQPCPSGPLKESKACQDKCCPVAGHLTLWGAWGACSKSCGGGVQRRDRSCVAPICYGSPCPSDPRWESQPCNQDCCPVNGHLTQWAPWTKCTKSCGKGQQGRKRECVEPTCGGQPCPFGVKFEGRPCNDVCCPVDGHFTQWSHWYACSKTCGGGVQTRSRSCQGRACGGKGCYGLLSENQPCGADCCPVDGYWTSWKSGRPGQCTKSCGKGERFRTRTCVGTACYGKYCEGPDTMSVVCNNFCCPVNGQWGHWHEGSCSAKCGYGTVTRTRKCDYPAPSCNGQPCVGQSNDSQSCYAGRPCSYH